MITLIACVDRNGGLGKDGKLLYHIPEDLAFLKALTRGQSIIVGRKALEEIPKSFLKDTAVHVLTHKKHPEYDCFSTPKDMVQWASWISFNVHLNIYVLGGQSVYNAFWEQDMVDYVFLGEYLGKPKEADVFFPMKYLKGQEKVNIYKTKDYEFNWYKIGL